MLQECSISFQIILRSRNADYLCRMFTWLSSAVGTFRNVPGTLVEQFTKPDWNKMERSFSFSTTSIYGNCVKRSRMFQECILECSENIHKHYRRTFLEQNWRTFSEHSGTTTKNVSETCRSIILECFGNVSFNN